MDHTLSRPLYASCGTALRMLLLALFLCLPVACGGGGGGGRADTVTGVMGTWCVDPERGEDRTADGSEENPFKTLGKALSMAGPGQVIQAKPGVYSQASGEAFPILVPPQVILLGDLATRGTGEPRTEIVGTGFVPPQGSGYQAAVIVREGARFAGFLVRNPYEVGVDIGTAVYVEDADVDLEALSVFDTAIGILGVRASALRITDCVIVRNGTGIRLDTSGRSMPHLTGNRIRGNTDGIRLRDCPSDLGGGPAGSAGGNILGGNAQVDLLITGHGAVWADDCFFDHVPPTENHGESPYPAGQDIAVDFGSVVVFKDGARLGPSTPEIWPNWPDP